MSKMNLLNRLTIKNLKLNQKRTVVTIIGILLSIAMLTAVASMFFSARASLIEYQMEQRGRYHYGFLDVPAEELGTFELNRKIEKYAIAENLGYAKLEGVQNEYKPYAFVKRFSEEAFEMLSVNLEEGRFPENENEIVIPSHVKINGGLSFKVGDKISLEIGTRMSDGYVLTQQNMFDPETPEEIVDTNVYEYEVVGIIERLSMGIEPYTAPGYTMLTYAEPESLSNSADVYLRYTKTDVKNHAKITANILGVDEEAFELYQSGDFWRLSQEEYEKVSEEALSGKYTFDYNENLVMLETGIIQNGTLQFLAAAAAIVAAIIIFTSVYCIKNSFDISITEKIRQYGMLSSIGATRRQIKRNVYHEALILGAVGLPMGIFSGLFASFVLMKISDQLLTTQLYFNLKFAFSWLTILIAVLLGALTIFLSARSSAVRASKITPIQAIRNSAEIQIKAKHVKTPKWVGKIFGIGGEISYKNLQRSKKKYRTTVVSIVICVTVFIAVSSFVEFAFKTVRVGYTTQNYNMAVSFGSHEITESKLSEMREIESVDQIVKRISSLMRFTTDKYSKDYLNYCIEQGMLDSIPVDMDSFEMEDSMQVYMIDQEAFREYVKELGLSFEKVRGKGILINQIFAEQYREEGPAKQIEIEQYTFQPGDVIEGSITRRVDEENEQIWETVSIEIAALAAKVPVGCDDFPNWGYMIVGEDFKEELLGEDYHGDIFIDSSDTKDTQEELEKMLGEDTDAVINYESEVESERSLFLLIAIFLYGFIVVIALIGVTNIFNTITTNMNLRRREFAMLKSVGMTKKEFDRMIQLESFFYGMKSLVIGIPVGLVLSVLIYLTMIGGMIQISYELPVKAILIAVVTVFVLVGVIMKYSMGQIGKQNIIETVRNENI